MVSKGMSLPPIVAVDFDGTLVEDKFPEIGPINQDMFDRIHRYQQEGYKVILWTCRTQQRLDDAILFCAFNGLHFDAVNDNIPEVIEKYNDNARKIYADIYIDDNNLSIEKALLRDGEPCGHRGCLSHITHPCECCGRIAGKRTI